MLTSSIIKTFRRWPLPTGIGHPRTYFTKEEISELIKKSEKCSELFNKVISRCDYYLSRLETHKIGNLRTLAHILEELSVAYVIKRKDAYLKKAQEIIKIILSQEDWVMPEHKPLKIDLGVAHVAQGLAISYDMLYEHLSSGERSKIEDILINNVLDPYLSICVNKSEWWTRSKYNWRSVICGRIGIVAITLAEEYPNAKACLEESIKGVLEVLDNGGIDGGWSEGIGYWGYGIGEAVRFADVLERFSNGVINLFEHQFLKKTGDFGLYCYTPDGGCFNFADCAYNPPNTWLMAKLASKYKNPYWQWYVNRNPPISTYGFIVYDPTLEEKDPNELPKSKHFRSIDIIVLRSGWNIDDVIFFFKSGKTAVSHSHLDINSFALNAYGKRLIVDLGRWAYAHAAGFFDVRKRRWEYDANDTIGHNTILVDGKGQKYGEDNYGKILKFENLGEYCYLVSDGTKAYGKLLNHFIRYVVYIKPYMFLIVDDLSSDEDRRYEWLLHYEGKIEGKDELRIINEPGVLDIISLKPNSEEDRVISINNRTSYYKATYGWVSYENKYLSIMPLHSRKDYRFVVFMNVRHLSEKVKIEAELIKFTNEEAHIRMLRDENRYQVYINFKKQDVKVKSLD